MLDTLDEINWTVLSHAYGPADDVPDQLRLLRSADPGDRQQALQALHSNIFHQGTRYEASAYAVPFLLELLADPATPEPADLIGLLVYLAVGYDEFWLPDGLPVAEFRRAAEGGAALLAAAPRPGDENYDEEYGSYGYVESLSGEDQERLDTYLALAAYDAVRAGVPLFRSLLTHPDPAVRTLAGYALAWFPEDAAESLPALAALVRSTVAADGAGVVATALVATGLLGGVPDTGLLGDPCPVVRWAAAVGRAGALGVDTDPGSVAELVTWTARPPDEPGVGPGHPGGYVPFLNGDLSGHAGLALRQVGPEHTDRAFDALLTRLPTVSGIEAMPVASEALRLAFPDGPLPDGTPFAALTVRQQRLVEVLGSTPETWLINGLPFGNFIVLVGAYGLPDSPEGLNAYLATAVIDGPRQR